MQKNWETLGFAAEKTGTELLDFNKNNWLSVKMRFVFRRTIKQIRYPKTAS